MRNQLGKEVYLLYNGLASLYILASLRRKIKRKRNKKRVDSIRPETA